MRLDESTAEHRLPLPPGRSSCDHPRKARCGKHMIEITGLSKLFGNFSAVRDLSFRVGPGEVLGLVGPNGAGKTTTLRTLAGIIPPSSGGLYIGGHDLLQDPINAKRQLAFFPDEPRLF